MAMLQNIATYASNNCNYFMIECMICVHVRIIIMSLLNCKSNK